MRHSMRAVPLLPLAAIACLSTPAHAQDSDVEALRAQIAELTAQLEAVNARLDEMESADERNAAAAAEAQAAADAIPAPVVTADTPVEISMGAAADIESADGFSFKPFGRLMLDSGWTFLPDELGRSDGFDVRARRVRLGAQGDIPGGFGYKMELEFGGNEVEITDALLEYETGDVTLSVGQFNNFQSMEELTSSRFTSFIERAAFTDAFGFIRRTGIAVEYGSGDVLLQGGLFSDNIGDLPGSDRMSVDGRAAYFPQIGDTQLHFGGSIHYADLGDGATVRYRQRPLVSFTSERLINTDRIDAGSEFDIGLEFAAVRGPLHVHAEGYRRELGGLVTMDDATFHGAFAEVGLFLTPDDSRTYRVGRFNRTRPARTVDEGGIGAVQLNLRYDFLELNDADAGIIGGTQNGLFGSLIWTTTDYTRFMLNYGHLGYDDAVFALPDGSRDYSVDVIGMRAEFDF
ncbi:hypothetical protein AAW01_01835 [Aurantiacibacter gangjinensis]|uniref:Porin n=2 Tax=Aurantiacibacter gangjinensis TaxID=502682 RepID=A0A0G9MS78_9SPHN|nr:hypothetical protein AAW01_01835 [Aurantiacibacter gangjinensis]